MTARARAVAGSLIFLVVAPAMLVPALIGARLYRRFSDAAFRKVVLGLLAASAPSSVLHWRQPVTRSSECPP